MHTIRQLLNHKRNINNLYLRSTGSLASLGVVQLDSDGIYECIYIFGRKCSSSIHDAFSVSCPASLSDPLSKYVL
jgi:hypothetical protein